MATPQHDEKHVPKAPSAKVLLFSFEWLDCGNYYHLFMNSAIISTIFPFQVSDNVEQVKGNLSREDQRPMWVFLFMAVLLIPGGLNTINKEKAIYHQKYKYLKEIHENSLYLKSERQVGAERVSPGVSPLFFLPLPINSADTLLLQTIPGIGPGLADKIVLYRQINGPLRNLDDLLNIQGIGTKRAAAWAKHLSFESSE